MAVVAIIMRVTHRGDGVRGRSFISQKQITAFFQPFSPYAIVFFHIIMHRRFIIIIARCAEPKLCTRTVLLFLLALETHHAMHRTLTDQVANSFVIFCHESRRKQRFFLFVRVDKLNSDGIFFDNLRTVNVKQLTGFSLRRSASKTFNTFIKLDSRTQVAEITVETEREKFVNLSDDFWRRSTMCVRNSFDLCTVCKLELRREYTIPAAKSTNIINQWQTHVNNQLNVYITSLMIARWN